MPPALESHPLHDHFVSSAILSDHGARVILAAPTTAWDTRRVLKKYGGQDATSAFDHLLTEYTALLDVDHAGVVGVDGIVQLDDEDYALVLHYVPGPTLESVLHRDGPISVDTTVSILAALADALVAVHDGGWLHCDICARNVLLPSMTRPVLIDFASVRSVMDLEPSDFRLDMVHPSPEQLFFEPLDPRSDIYALGALGCTMLTGKAQPTGTRPQDWLSDCASLPADLVNTLTTMMALEREDRPRRMRVVSALLAALRIDDEEHPTAVRLPHRREMRTPRTTPLEIPSIDVLGETRLPAGVTRSTPHPHGELLVLHGHTLVVVAHDGGPPRIAPMLRAVELLAADGHGRIHTSTRDGVVIVDPSCLRRTFRRVREVIALAVGSDTALAQHADATWSLTRNDYKSWWCSFEPAQMAAVSNNDRWVAFCDGEALRVFELHPNSYELAIEVVVPPGIRGLAVSNEGIAFLATAEDSIVEYAHGRFRVRALLGGVVALHCFDELHASVLDGDRHRIFRLPTMAE